MKATDLMIGDWVIRRGVPEEPMRLYNMNASRGIAYLDQDGRGVAELFENIEPILLTPQILEKNGFDSRGAQFFCDKIGMIWWKDNIFMFSKYTRHEDLPTENISINIGYVHELQHALKLCGIEKEIIL